jgi:hypothetical protein
MAVANLLETKLRMVFEKGMDEKGNPILNVKTFNNIKKEATTDQLFQVATAISALVNDSLTKIERNYMTDIMA